ncbi:MAG TPA: DUF2058 family protein [Rudaea sp.]|nr:DUF2058 family protein [Rudaea sp.]
MSESLRDQLLKAGFVQKPVEKPKPTAAGKPKTHAHAKPQLPKRKEAEIDLARAYAQRANIERNEREQAQREAERIAREKKERKQKLTALLAGKSLNSADADVPRHFPHGNKIRRIYCTKEQIERLNCGDMAVVQLAGRYLLVTREVAMQAQAIQPESLVLLCDPNAPAEDDVPADLMW